MGIKTEMDTTTSSPALDDSFPNRTERSSYNYLQLAVVLLMALGVVVVLMFDDDRQWLRIGIVAALWATYIEACIVVHYRKQIFSWDESGLEAEAEVPPVVSPHVDDQVWHQVKSEPLRDNSEPLKG